MPGQDDSGFLDLEEFREALELMDVEDLSLPDGRPAPRFEELEPWALRHASWAYGERAHAEPARTKTLGRTHAVEAQPPGRA